MCRYVVTFIIISHYIMCGDFMSRYTTIRISFKDKERLQRLAKLMGCKSLADTLRYVLDIAEKEIEKYKVDPSFVLTSLKHARDVGETNAEEVDKYLYGES